MKVRQVLAAAIVFAAFGVEPPIVEANVMPGPFRFTVATENDNPHFVLLGGKRGANVRARKLARCAPRYA